MNKMNPPSWFIDLAHIDPVVKAVMSIPLTMIFLEGEVYAAFDNLRRPSIQKSMARKLKAFVEIKPFTGPGWLLEGPRIAYTYYEHSSRRKAYRKRMAMKAMFTYHRGLLKSARQCTQRDFLSHNDQTPELMRVLKHNGFKSLKHLWQVCNNKDLDIPQIQKDLTNFMR